MPSQMFLHDLMQSSDNDPVVNDENISPSGPIRRAHQSYASPSGNNSHCQNVTQRKPLRDITKKMFSRINTSHSQRTP